MIARDRFDAGTLLRALVAAGRRLPAACFVAVQALALGGCGEKSTGGPLEPELFPLNAGLRWQYQVTTDAHGKVSREIITVENRGPQAVGPEQKAAERRYSTGNSYYFASDAKGIYRVALRNELDDEPRADKDASPRFVLRMPIAKGTTWDVQTRPYILLKPNVEWPREMKYGKPIQMGFKIESIDEPVQVPAGRFEHCVLVVGQHWMRLSVDALTGWSDVPIVNREWYCPKVGLVKFVRTEITNGRAITGGTMTFELLEGPDAR